MDLRFYLPQLGLSNVIVRDFREQKTEPTEISRAFTQPQSPATEIKRNYPQQELLGTMVADNLVLGGLVSDGEKIADFKFETAIMSVSQRKNIVSTPVVGRDGSVHQYVSDGDYDISITGLLVQNTHTWEELQHISKLMQAKQFLTPYSQLLQIFNISLIIVTSFTFTQKEGYEKLFKIDVSARSANPINLRDYVING